MSEFTEAFAELNEAQEESDGFSSTITVGGVTAPCVITTLNTDLIAIDGASAMDGGYSCQVLASYFPSEPAKGSPVFVSCYPNEALEITSDPAQSHGVYTFTIGDLAATD